MKLIKNIQGEILSEINSEVNILKPIVAELGNTDYIELNKSIFFLQNLTQASSVIYFDKINDYGLKQIKIRETIEISY